MSLQAPEKTCTVCRGEGVVYRLGISRVFAGKKAYLAHLCDCMRHAVKSADAETLALVNEHGKKLLKDFKALAKGGSA